MKTKHLLLILAVFVVGLSSALGESGPVTIKSQSATVYIYRSSAWLSIGRKYWVYANGKPICKIGNKRHCQLTLPTGAVTFTTKLVGLTLVPKKRPSLTLTLEAGKSYYLQADLETKFFPLQAVLPLTEVVPNASKLEEIQKSKTEQALAGFSE